MPHASTAFCCKFIAPRGVCLSLSRTWVTQANERRARAEVCWDAAYSHWLKILTTFLSSSYVATLNMTMGIYLKDLSASGFSQPCRWMKSSLPLQLSTETSSLLPGLPASYKLNWGCHQKKWVSRWAEFKQVWIWSMQLPIPFCPPSCSVFCL